MVEFGTARWVLVGAAALTLTGCYTMQPHAMHSGMYAPGVAAYPPPRQTFAVPAGSLPAPTGTIITTPPTTFAPTRSTAPQQAPAPLANPGPSSAENPVPLPRDANLEGSAEPEEKTSSVDREMGLSAPRPRRYEFGLKSPLPTASEEFVEPRTAEGPGGARIAVKSLPAFENEINQVAYQNLSSHDPQFRWIQGVLQYNASRKAWHLMYNANPGKDPLGGEVTLSGHLPFTLEDHNQIVRVTGQFHDRLIDRMQKPQYVVTQVERLAPADLER